MKYQLKVNDKTYEIERKQDGYYLNNKKLDSDEETNDYIELEDGFHFLIDGFYYKVLINKEDENSSANKLATGLIVSPMNGTVYSIDCQLNAKVKNGEKLLTIEAMKMLYPIFADMDGIITLCSVSKGDTVKSNKILIKIDP